MRLQSTASSNALVIFLIATWSPVFVSFAAQMRPYAPWPTPFFTSYRSSTSKVVPLTTYWRLAISPRATAPRELLCRGAA